MIAHRAEFDDGLVIENESKILLEQSIKYLLLLDANPDIAAWTFDELPREDQDRYRKDAKEGLVHMY